MVAFWSFQITLLLLLVVMVVVVAVVVVVGGGGFCCCCCCCRYCCLSNALELLFLPLRNFTMVEENFEISPFFKCSKKYFSDKFHYG